MRHYVVPAKHGPLVFTQRSADWVVGSPYRPPEVIAGLVPLGLLQHVREISRGEAEQVFGTDPGVLAMPVR